MGCVDIGKLRAFCDGEVASGEAKQIETHVARCISCREQLDGVRKAGSFVAAKMNAIAPLPGEAPPGIEASLAAIRRREPRLATKTAEGNTARGLSRWIGGLVAGATFHWRASVAGLVAVAVVISLVALPPVRTIADDLLGIFRVQKFTQVTLDPGTLKNLPNFDPSKMGTFDGITREPSSSTVASPAEAAARLDFPLRLPQHLPAGVTNNPKLAVTDSFSVAYTFDLARATTYMASMGITGIDLPKSLNGQKISGTMPVHVIASYGEGVPGAAMALFQGRSPVVEIPDGVNLDEVFNAIYSLPGLPPELVVQLRAIDWRTTAPVPVLKGDTSRKLTVDGVEGLLVRNDIEKVTVLFWQKDGIVYVMAGDVADSDLVAAANSLK
ncbi:MAG: hypothetical protein HYX94_06065 [Chloroflexi bacterium]|nr:hypothetical protein [Chloroflexota bacterium]